MHPQALLAVTLILGLGFVLNTASCSDQTCPAGQQSCGTQNGSAAGAAGNAGSAGSASTETCPELQAVQACMDAFCTTKTNPFCTCYKRGLDLSPSCVCSRFDAHKFCVNAQAAGVDAANYDCPSATSAVATMCVGVQ